MKFEEKKDSEEKDIHKSILSARKQSQTDLKQSLLKVEEVLEEDLEVDKPKESQKLNNFLALKKLDFQIKKGEFVCIIGDVGSGKSSLLQAIIGDMLYLPPEVV